MYSYVCTFNTRTLFLLYIQYIVHCTVHFCMHIVQRVHNRRRVSSLFVAFPVRTHNEWREISPRRTDPNHIFIYNGARTAASLLSISRVQFLFSSRAVRFSSFLNRDFRSSVLSPVPIIFLLTVTAYIHITKI